MSDNRPIDRIDDRHMMAVLLFLLENGPSNRTDIYNNTSRNSNMSRRLDELVEMGLLTFDVSYHGISMKLSDRGYSVAQSLALIEKTLRGQP